LDENQFEMAERLEQAQRDAAIYKASSNAAPEKHEDFDGEHCVICDEPIPLARLGLGKVRCVECQTNKEKRRA
jgi:RNA polymerase-binding transcription factor DksA